MLCDVRIQFRNGFYYALAFLLGGWAILISQLRLPGLDAFLPALILGNLVIGTFFFMGGLVLLEKGEGTLEAQIVTPLRIGEYLASKIVTLSLLAIAEHVLLVAIATGYGFRPLPLIAGCVLASVLYCLIGFLAVSPFDSINEYLLPSMLYVSVFSIPFLPYFELWESRLFYLHPLQAPLILLSAAFRPIETWQWFYGVLYSLLWSGLLFWASRRAFRRFIIRKEGTP